jgi:DNA modification methylase
MCVTSPPYYGLRDYGTGKWIGGDPKCPHRRLSKFSGKTITGHKQSELIGNVGDAIYKTICPLCGAVREDKQIGLEETPEDYVRRLVDVFREVRRVLKDDGTLWINIGDSYWGSGSRGYDFTGKFSEASKIQANSKGTIALQNIPKLVGTTDTGIKNKDLIGIPWMLAFALREDGWYLRQDIIWHKPNPMPESVKDRCTKSHEYVFLLSKKPHYYFDYKAIQEESVCKDDPRAGKGHINYDGKYSEASDGHQQAFVKITEVRNKRDVWSVTVKANREAHFATYPEDLIEPCIKAGSRVDGIVLDPFFGSGTTGIVAERLNRRWLGIELNPEYVDIAKRRTDNIQMTFYGLMDVI